MNLWSCGLLAGEVLRAVILKLASAGRNQLKGSLNTLPCHTPWVLIQLPWGGVQNLCLWQVFRALRNLSGRILLSLTQVHWVLLMHKALETWDGLSLLEPYRDGAWSRHLPIISRKEHSEDEINATKFLSPQSTAPQLHFLWVSSLPFCARHG